MIISNHWEKSSEWFKGSHVKGYFKFIKTVKIFWIGLISLHLAQYIFYIYIKIHTHTHAYVYICVCMCDIATNQTENLFLENSTFSKMKSLKGNKGHFLCIFVAIIKEIRTHPQRNYVWFFFLCVPLGDGVEKLKIRSVKDKISNKAFHQDVCVHVCVSTWTGKSAVHLPAV